jgi:hypothetical protein
MVRLYRTRALEALQNARLARDAADIDGMRSCVVAMRFWRRLARAWTHKTVWIVFGTGRTSGNQLLALGAGCVDTV